MTQSAEARAATIEVIKEALISFSWTNYRFHDVDETIQAGRHDEDYEGDEEEDPSRLEWAGHLAERIQKALEA